MPSAKPTAIADGCPAFVTGCPFSSPTDSAEIDIRAATKMCPAFGEGCTFKNARSIEDLEAMLAKIPETHKIDGKTFGSSAALKAVLQAIHSHAMTTSEREGLGECPVFSTSCPFKNVTSQGSPLVSELEYRTWSIFENLEDTGDASASNVDDDDEISEGQAPALLAKELKSGTKKSHRAAESVQFVRNFLRGRVDRELYKHMLLSLWHTYSALEDELRKNADQPVYSSLHFPAELDRKDALEADLAYFFGEDWRDDADVKAGPSECTQEYVDRIRTIGRNNPELLVAHAYTRYLGDLSGGQVLKRVAIKAMHLPDDGTGTEFYEFPMVSNAKVFKDEYRRRLDNTEVDVATIDRIVAEANLAFVLNMRVFEELDVMACESDRVRPLAEVLATLDLPVDQAQKCPFSAMGGPNPHTKGDAEAMQSGQTSTKACPIPHTTFANVMSWLQPIVVVGVALLAAYVMTK